LPSNASAAGDVTITVKGQSGEEFQITSPTGQLEKIGELLRGKSKGSGIRTLVISISASAATLVFSGAIAAGFQYVSWANTVIVSNASDRVAKARDAFNEAIKAIGDRYMASRNFVTALQDLANNQATADSNLGKITIDVDHARMSDYYDKLKQWNVGYNALLVRIDYDLDRRIYLLANENLENPVASAKTKEVDCKGYVTEQMRQAGYDQHSLKAQFAIVNHCFVSISKIVDDLETKILSDKKFRFDDEAKKTVDASLDDVNTTTNTFQCYAKQRQEFYVSQIGDSVINPLTLIRLFFYEHAYGHDYLIDYMRKIRRPAALAHFKVEDMQCDRTYSAAVKP